MSPTKAAAPPEPSPGAGPVVGSFAFLTFVAVSKTLLTKFVFTHVDTPVAFSVLSCVATILVMLPVFACFPNLYQPLKLSMLKGFLGVSLAIAADLGCTNVAISELSVAMQQTIKATSPAATVLLEIAFNRKCTHPIVLVLITLLCSLMI